MAKSAQMSTHPASRLEQETVAPSMETTSPRFGLSLSFATKQVQCPPRSLVPAADAGSGCRNAPNSVLQWSHTMKQPSQFISDLLVHLRPPHFHGSPKASPEQEPLQVTAQKAGLLSPHHLLIFYIFPDFFPKTVNAYIAVSTAGSPALPHCSLFPAPSNIPCCFE